MELLALLYKNDIQLVKEYSETGSEKAASYFVRKYRNFVFATALRYMNNYDDADDAAQETFIKALKSLNRFNGKSSLQTWLYRITVNTCLNMKRKKSFLSYFNDKEKPDYHNIKSEYRSPEQVLADKEFESEFSGMLASLPEKQRETFALRYFEEMPYEEISNMLGTSVGGLKANYYQATKKLANLLKSKNKEV